MKKRKKIKNIFAVGGNISAQNQYLNAPNISVNPGQILGNLNSNSNIVQQAGGSFTPTGITGNPMGAISGGINLASSVANDLFGKIEVPNLPVQNITNTQANSNDQIMNDWSNFTPQEHYNRSDVKSMMQNGTSMVGKIGGGALSGAAIGSVIPGIGTALGAVGGGLISGISGIFGNNRLNKKVKRETNRLNREIDKSNERSFANLSNRVDAIDSQNDWNTMSNFFGNGGKMFAYGGDFTNGINSFNTGGTHENNPLGGIPISIDQEGNPNLVEENEVQWGDYIFSDRLGLGKDLVKEFNLPKYVGNKSFAKAAEKIQQESKERENDPISKNTLNDFLSKLQVAQENIKQLIGEDNQNVFATGGQQNKKLSPWIATKLNKPNKVQKGTNFDNNNLPQIDKNNILSKEILFEGLRKRGFPEDQLDKAYEIMMRESGGIFNNYRLEKDNPGGGNDLGLFQINTKYHPDMYSKYNLLDIEGNLDAMVDIYNRHGWKPWKASSKNNPNDSNNNDLELPKNIGNNNTIKPKTLGEVLGIQPTTTNDLLKDMTVSTVNKNPITTPNTMSGNTPTSTKGNISGVNDYLRYAPAAANALLFANSLFESPETMNLERAKAHTIGAGQLGNYLSYNPVDSEYIANNIRAQAAATQRGIVNQSAGNRATATAGLIAADYNLNNALGDAYFKANEINENKRRGVEEFNRSTNMFNISNDLQSQQFNASALNQLSQFNTGIANHEQILNAQNRAAARSARRDSFVNFANNLGQIGTENRWMDIAPIINRGYDQYGIYKAMGGRIFKKRIKR